MSQTLLGGTWTWPGGTADPSTILATNTSGLLVGEWIRADGDRGLFRVTVITPNVDVTVANPAGDTLPSGVQITLLTTDPALLAVSYEHDGADNSPEVFGPVLMAVNYEHDGEAMLEAKKQDVFTAGTKVNVFDAGDKSDAPSQIF